MVDFFIAYLLNIILPLINTLAIIGTALESNEIVKKPYGKVNSTLYM